MRVLRGVVLVDSVTITMTAEQLAELPPTRAIRDQLDQYLAAAGLAIAREDDVVMHWTPDVATHSVTITVLDRGYGQRAEQAINAAAEKAERSRRVPHQL